VYINFKVIISITKLVIDNSLGSLARESPCILSHYVAVKKGQENKSIFEMNQTHHLHIYLYFTSLTQGLNQLGCKHFED
jgi:hypothetical protein